MTTLLSTAGSTPLAVSVTFPAPGVARLSVAGGLDLVSGRMLGMGLLTLLDTHRSMVIDIDFESVTFLDCSAMGVLVAVHNAAQRTGCQIRISRTRDLGTCGPVRRSGRSGAWISHIVRAGCSGVLPEERL